MRGSRELIRPPVGMAKTFGGEFRETFGLRLAHKHPSQRSCKSLVFVAAAVLNDAMSEIVLPPPLKVHPQPTQKVRKSDRTRAAILNAALDFVWSHPFRAMTVAKVMDAAGLSRSAFYPHFSDLHAVMSVLLEIIGEEILTACQPWLTGTGDPSKLVEEALNGMVGVCYQRGPFLRAITDAASMDKRFDEDWTGFLEQFDEVACARIEADQAQGLVPKFDALPVATALNRLDAYTVVQAFGQHPRSQPEPVQEALARIWISTLYGSETVSAGASKLVRK